VLLGGWWGALYLSWALLYFVFGCFFNFWGLGFAGFVGLYGLALAALVYIFCVLRGALCFY
jgi:hypothetical protein